jgi:hypothetical protein
MAKKVVMSKEGDLVKARLRSALHNGLVELAEILERCGGDLVALAEKKGLDKVAEQLTKKITMGPPSRRVLEEIADLGAETAKERLAQWLKKSR